MESKSSQILSDNWKDLKKYTDARIALGRSGSALPTDALLEFQLAHARARDAVYSKIDTEDLKKKLIDLSFNPILLDTKAFTRAEYLKNPDLGRQLSENSIKELQNFGTQKGKILFMIVDGLSAIGIIENAVSFLELILKSWDISEISPIVPIVQQGRVAIGDAIGSILEPEIGIVLIGERPGLSSPGSVGIYITYNPKIGRKDSQRNCISNLRKDGLPLDIGSQKLLYLVNQAKKLKLTGIHLKDDLENELTDIKLKTLGNID
jgi:ethanolamine ammonia-lyase small subunit